jgi:hypothetical protein
VRVDGGHGSAEATEEAVYLAMSLRNVGTGLAVLQGWGFAPGTVSGADAGRPDPGTFIRLTRDIYVAAGDIGFWQGALRDRSDERFTAARTAVEAREGLTIDLLYGDVEGGQRVISRFALQPAGDDGWLASIGRHWNLDRPDPR